jgi:hypothetical protein
MHQTTMHTVQTMVVNQKLMMRASTLFSVSRSFKGDIQGKYGLARDAD